MPRTRGVARPCSKVKVFIGVRCGGRKGVRPASGDPGPPGQEHSWRSTARPPPIRTIPSAPELHRILETAGPMGHSSRALPPIGNWEAGFPHPAPKVVTSNCNLVSLAQQSLQAQRMHLDAWLPYHCHSEEPWATENLALTEREILRYPQDDAVRRGCTDPNFDILSQHSIIAIHQWRRL